MINLRVLVGAAAAALLAACAQQQPGPAVIPPATNPLNSTTASSSAPSTVPPTSSSSARGATGKPSKLDEATAFAVVKAYYAALNRATATLDTAEYEALSSDRCSGCNDNLKLLRYVRDQGGRFDVPPVTVSDVKGGLSADSERARLLVNVRFAGGKVYDAKGVVRDTYGTGVVLQQIVLKKEGGQWVVDDVRKLSD